MCSNLYAYDNIRIRVLLAYGTRMRSSLIFELHCSCNITAFTLTLLINSSDKYNWSYMYLHCKFTKIQIMYPLFIPGHKGSGTKLSVCQTVGKHLLSYIKVPFSSSNLHTQSKNHSGNQSHAVGSPLDNRQLAARTQNFLATYHNPQHKC